MYKFISIVSLLLIFSFTSTGNKPSKKEKKDAISYFKETQANLLKEVNGLSETQLNWKPADSVWSVANCVEHITLAEKNLFDWAMSTLKEPANPARRSEVKNDDETIKKMITDRSFKAKAPEGFRPTGQFGNTANSLDTFNMRRAALISYMKKTDEDLRNHFATTPLGVVDTYQVLLFLSAHSRRHTLQIAEVKAMPGFPKE